MKIRNGVSQDVIHVVSVKGLRRNHNARVDVVKQVSRYDKECGPVVVYRYDESGELVRVS